MTNAATFESEMFRKPLARLLLCVGLSGSHRVCILLQRGGEVVIALKKAGAFLHCR